MVCNVDKNLQPGSRDWNMYSSILELICGVYAGQPCLYGISRAVWNFTDCLSTKFLLTRSVRVGHVIKAHKTTPLMYKLVEWDIYCCNGKAIVDE